MLYAAVFISGVLLGCAAGILLAGLCSAARRAEDEAELWQIKQ